MHLRVLFGLRFHLYLDKLAYRLREPFRCCCLPPHKAIDRPQQRQRHASTNRRRTRRERTQHSGLGLHRFISDSKAVRTTNIVNCRIRPDHSGCLRYALAQNRKQFLGFNRSLLAGRHSYEYDKPSTCAIRFEAEPRTISEWRFSSQPGSSLTLTRTVSRYQQFCRNVDRGARADTAPSRSPAVDLCFQFR